VTREVFSAAEHAAIGEPTREREREARGLARITREGAIADDRVLGVGVDVEDRREIEVDAEPSELGADGPLPRLDAC
jgi:hypothetical protein